MHACISCEVRSRFNTGTQIQSLKTLVRFETILSLLTGQWSIPSDTVSTPTSQERPPEDGRAAISDLHKAEGLWFAGHVLGYWVTKQSTYICFFMTQIIKWYIFRSELCIKDPEYLYCTRLSDEALYYNLEDLSIHWSIRKLIHQPIDPWQPSHCGPSSAALRWLGGEPAVTRGKENPHQRSRCCTSQTRGGTKFGLDPLTRNIISLDQHQSIDHWKSKINSIPVHLHELLIDLNAKSQKSAVILSTHF